MHIAVGSDSGHGPPKDKDKEKAKDYKREKSRERKDKKDKAKDGLKGSREKDKMRQGGKDRELAKEKEVEGDEEGVREGDLKEREKENMTLSGHGHEPHHERKGSKDESSAPPLPHSHKNKHVRRPIFAEKDVRAVCRNANELLRFHDQFVRELREAVDDYGLARAFVLPEHGEEERTKPVEGAEPVVLERIDEAVSVVAEKFINQVRLCGFLLIYAHILISATSHVGTVLQYLSGVLPRAQRGDESHSERAGTLSHGMGRV